MRHRDLFGLSLVLSIGIVYFVVYLLPKFGLHLGYLTFGSPLVASFVLAPLLMLILTPFNQRLREWRKTQGRDIELEERYETEYGMIRLTPNEDKINIDNEDSGIKHLH